MPTTKFLKLNMFSNGSWLQGFILFTYYTGLGSGDLDFICFHATEMNLISLGIQSNERSTKISFHQ